MTACKRDCEVVDEGGVAAGAGAGVVDGNAAAGGGVVAGAGVVAGVGAGVGTGAGCGAGVEAAGGVAAGCGVAGFGANAGAGVGVGVGAGAGVGFVFLIGGGCTTPGAGTPGFDATGLKLSSSGIPSAHAAAKLNDRSMPALVIAAATVRNVIPPLQVLYLRARSR